MSMPNTSARPFFDLPPVRILVVLGVVYVLAGALYAMASIPNLLVIIARIDSGPTYVDRSLAFLRDTAGQWADALTVASYSGTGRVCLQLALFALPLMWIAALIRTARVRSPRPIQITVLAGLLGLIGIPIATWIGWLLWAAWRIAGYVMDFIAWIAPWVTRIFLWILVAVMVVAAIAAVVYIGWILVRLILALTQGRRWIGVLLVAAAVAAVAGALAAGWLDGLLAVIAHAFAVAWTGLVAGIEWIVALVAPVFGFIGRVIAAVAVFLVAAGLFTALFGQIGRIVCLPVAAAVNAGATQGKCADLAAGVGVAGSVVATAAVLDPTFGHWFAVTWKVTPVFTHLPVPTGIYAFLIPDSAETLLRPAFTGFSSFLDVGLLLLLMVIGTFSLLFSVKKWQPGARGTLWVPVMLGVGLAIAAALFLIAILSFAALSRGDD